MPLIITDVVLVHLYYLPKVYTAPIFPAKAGKCNYKLAENRLQKNDTIWFEILISLIHTINDNSSNTSPSSPQFFGPNSPSNDGLFIYFNISIVVFVKERIDTVLLMVGTCVLSS